jgi:hypothetical protein
MRARLALAPSLLALAWALLLPSAANAAYDPLASGTTTLTIDKTFAAYLKQNGITLSATAPAKRKGTKITLPVTAGKWDPTLGKGTAESEGSFFFQSARKKLPFRDVVVKAKSTPLYAKVGGGQLKVAEAKKISPTRFGFGAKLTAGKLTLTQKAATRLQKKLRPEEQFQAGQVIGTLNTQVAPRTIAVQPKGRAYLAPDPAFLAKLDQLHVSVNPIAPAELSAGPLFSFPVAAEGQIAPDGSLGTLRTSGELEFLRLGSGQVFWREQWLDLATRTDLAEVELQPDPPFGGKQGQLGVMSFGGGAVASDPKARTVSLQGAALALSAGSAQSFNAAFAQGKAVFGAGELVGAVSFVAQGQ